MTDTQSVKPCCHSHPQELAVAICFEEKLFLCPDCLVEDRHLSKGVVTLKKLNGFLQEKKQTLIQHQERIESGLASDTQAKEITKAVLARIEPIVHEIVMTELKGSRAEPKDIQELLRKVDNLIVSNQATGSVEVVAEMENEIKKLESTGSQPLVDKNINTIAKRVSGLLQGTSCEEPVRQERSRKTSFDVGLHFGEFIQLPEKESYTGLEITFGKRSDQIPSFCSELKKFKRLSDLQLDFCFCTSMNDEKLTELSSTLKSMSSLTKLQIKFWDTTALSDVGIKELSSALKSLSSLTELQLQFSCCSLISNAGLKDLSLALTKLSSLTSLQLNFISCGLISDAGLKEVSSALKRIPSLKKLNLDFSSCGIIRDDDVKELIVSIKSVDTLTHLQLDFSGIDSLSGEGKTELDLLLTNYKKI